MDQVSKPINYYQINRYTAAIRSRLGKLAALGAKAKASEDAIQEAANKRLEAVDADLAKLRPRVMLDDEAARKFEELTLERGRLMRMIGEVK
jgi:hypothetical protein